MTSAKSGKFYIGTSNVVVPGNKQTFPAEYASGSRLHYYASFFNSLEINSSFYKVPQASTFQRWAADVPEDFRFTVKLWKEITHCKGLAFDNALVEHFMKAADGLGHKIGCVLVQFPGKINFDYYSPVEELVTALRNTIHTDDCTIAVEFRNNSWYVPETFEMLDEYAATLVLHDIPRSKIQQPTRKAKTIYLRFHGMQGDYRGSYDTELLREYAGRIGVWCKEGKDVYAYFNNTIGNAFENARQLKIFVEEMLAQQ